jgi:hypothetical protein
VLELDCIEPRRWTPRLPLRAGEAGAVGFDFFCAAFHALKPLIPEAARLIEVGNFEETTRLKGDRDAGRNSWYAAGALWRISGNCGDLTNVVEDQGTIL